MERKEIDGKKEGRKEGRRKASDSARTVLVRTLLPFSIQRREERRRGLGGDDGDEEGGSGSIIEAHR